MEIIKTAAVMATTTQPSIAAALASAPRRRAAAGFQSPSLTGERRHVSCLVPSESQDPIRLGLSN